MLAHLKIRQNFWWLKHQVDLNVSSGVFSWCSITIKIKIQNFIQEGTKWKNEHIWWISGCKISLKTCLSLKFDIRTGFLFVFEFISVMFSFAANCVDEAVFFSDCLCKLLSKIQLWKHTMEKRLTNATNVIVNATKIIAYTALKFNACALNRSSCWHYKASIEDIFVWDLWIFEGLPFHSQVRSEMM